MGDIGYIYGYLLVFVGLVGCIMGYITHWLISTDDESENKK